jgi:FkbM family methyltransferase
MKDVRLRLLRERKVEVVLDVGANAGQYAGRLRDDGYEGVIVSFEPLAEAYERLESASADDPTWHTMRVALAAEPGTATIHVSANSYSSSFLPIEDRHVHAAPDAAYVGTELVDVVTLDRLALPPGVTMLKMDVQGTEPSVLRGARELLSRVVAVEAELSLVPIYEGQDLAPTVCQQLRDAGFVPVAFDIAFTEPTTGEILCVDGLFARVHSSA